MRLSFIIPCYNVAKYIVECLGSIYAQRLSEDEFEIICVNDYSTDTTRDIIENIQKEHTNLILLNQPLNMYSGAARNRGLEIARGEYIWFVDADDKIKPDVANHLIDMATSENLDLLLFNYDEFNDGKENDVNVIDDIFTTSTIMSGNEFVKILFNYNLSSLSLLWLRLFRRSLIDNNNIRFSNLYISQDGPFAYETLLMADRVQSIKDRCYLYRVNSQSITANKNTARKNAVWSFQYPLELYKLKERVFYTVYQKIISQIDKNIHYEINEYSRRYLLLPKSKKNKYYNIMCENKDWYKIAHLYLTKKNKIIYKSRLLGEFFFRTMINILL